MNEFVLLFHRANDAVPSPSQLQSTMKQWEDWIGSIAARNKLASTGNRLSSEGRVVKSNSVVTDGPYAEIKESLGGYIIVKAKDYDDAVTLAKGCPILKIGGNVEVRQTVPMDGDR